MNQPMPIEEYRAQIKKWVKEKRWDLIKLSARKRREYVSKEDNDIKDIFGIKP